MSGLEIIFILIFLSGVIAYLGDLIGRRVGKKRVRIFSLRPRHTAIIITILSGILISLFTISVILIISKDARDALFRIRVIKKNLKTLEKRYNLQKKELSKKLKEIEKLKKEWELTHISKKELEKKYTQTKENLIIAEEKLSRLNNKKRQLEEKIESLRRQGDEVFEKLKDVRSELEEVEEERERITKSLEEVKSKKIIFKADQEILKISMEGGGEDKKIREEIIKVLKEVNEIALLTGAKTEKENEGIIVFEFQIEDLIKNIKKRKENLILRILSAENTVEGEPLFLKFELYIDKLIFKKGEIIWEELFYPGKSEKEIEEILSKILNKIREIALKKGILPDPEGEVGEINALKFYNTVEKIKKLKEKAKLKVISVKDVYRDGLLEVDFIIE